MNRILLTLGIAFLFGNMMIAQNVGISDQIFTPQSPMHVYRTTDGNLLQLSRSTAANSGFQIAVTGTNNYQLINRQYGSMSFFTNNLERMRIIDEGRVMINFSGTSEHQLTVGGNNRTLRLTGSEAGFAGGTLSFGPTDPVNIYGLTYIRNYASLRLRIHSGNSTVFTGNSATGGVGITNLNADFIPQSLLHVYRNQNANFLQLSHSISASTGLIFSLDSDGWNMRNHEDNALTVRTGDGFLRFMTNDLERMRVTSAGNVGIGTDAPTTLLHVHGGVRFSDLPTPSAQSTFLVIDPSGYVQARYLPPASFTPPEPAWLLAGNAGTDPTINYLGTSDATDLVIRTSGAERIRVLSTGNVGIGTNNPQRPFHLSGIARISTLAEPAGALVRSNADGDLSTIALTGDPNDVLLGDGTWGTVATSAWEISGNNNTVEGTNFIGTTNAQGLDIRTNNFLSFRVTQDAFAPPAGGGGRLLAAYFGNANSPIYSFLDDSRMGMYRSAPNQLSFSTNGTERLRLPNSAQIQSFHTGTAAIPAWSFVNSTAMGMYMIGNNILGFSTNSLERIRINPLGHVGINNPAPAQPLDVGGNVRFSGALMPDNQPGANGAFLRSQGANLPPVWTQPGLTVTNVYSISSTGNLCINNVTFATYPGCTQTIALVAGQRVVAFAEAGLMVDNNCDGFSDVSYVIVDARIAVNGNDFPNGAWLRTSLDNWVGYVVFNSVTLIGEFTAPVSGNYTFDLQARWSGGNGFAISGGNNTSALQATLVLVVYTP
jgi:hypothetical protein